MSAVATAVVASAVVGGVVASKGAKAQSKAASSAASSSAQSTADTNAMNWKMYEQTRTDQEPWRLAGEAALKNIQKTPDFSFSSEDFFSDPSYDFRMEQGINALDRSAASRGRLKSGAQDKAVTEYGQKLASTEYVNAYNRALTEYNTNLAKEQSLAQVGQSATNVVSAAGQNTANITGQNTMAGTNAINSANMAGANAQARGMTGIATSINQGIGNYLLTQQ